MEVKLEFHTPLWIAAKAIRRCWNSGDKSDTRVMECPGFPTIYGEIGEKDKELIHRVGNKNKHSSTLEHLVYNFEIKGVSRALLQELARHRIASPTVKSTRYTLKELKTEECFTDCDDEGYLRASKYIVFTEDDFVNEMIVKNLENLRTIIKAGIANDLVKYALPEAYKTELSWTINARSLQNFLSLRTNKAALWEIKDLANEIFNKLPEEHKYLFEEFISETS